MIDRLVTFSEEQITEYLRLVDRLISLSDIGLESELAHEFEEIYRLMKPLRKAIDSALVARSLVSGFQNKIKTMH